MNVYFVSIGNRPYAQYVAKSFKKYMPMDTKVIQITDYKTLKANNVDEVIRYPYYGRHMMLFMITAFADIKDEKFITTGDDCIINGSLENAISGEYDICICKRTKQKLDNNGNNHIDSYPYTNGLVIVNHPFFYIDCLDRLLRMQATFWDWLGDMKCIKESLESDRYLIKYLPQDKYCRIPNKIGQGDDSSVLWHYAGEVRKSWMKYHGKGTENLASM